MLYCFNVDLDSASDVIDEEFKFLNKFREILFLIKDLLNGYDYGVSFNDHQIKLLFNNSVIFVQISNDKIYIYNYSNSRRSESNLENFSKNFSEIIKLSGVLSKNEQIVKDILV